MNPNLAEPAVVLDGAISAAEARVKVLLHSDLAWTAVRAVVDEEVVWYVLASRALLEETHAAGTQPLLDVLDRQRHRAEVRGTAGRTRGYTRGRHRIVLDGTEVVGVVPAKEPGVIPGHYRDWLPRFPYRGAGSASSRFLAWPIASAPHHASPGETFLLTVTLSRERRDAPAIDIKLLERETEIELDVDVAAVGLDAPAGWRHTLHVPTSGALPSLDIPLRVRRETAPGPVLIHVAFLHRGIVCGHATCAITIGPASVAAIPGAASPCTIPNADELAADLVVMIRKADGNAATGQYVWSMMSTRAAIDPGPFRLDLGDDARTFARTLMNDIDDTDNTAILDPVLRSIGRKIADRIPPPFWDALRAVADAVAAEGRLPAVLLYSAEEHVPWELALMDPPFAGGPPYLAAQTILGRWLHSQRGTVASSPPSTIPVQDIAVLAPDYGRYGKLPSLDWAVAEAKSIVETYGAIGVMASMEQVRRLVDADVTRGDGSRAEIRIVHFACHGRSDPAQPGDAGLLLGSGRRIPPSVFGASRLGRKFGPLLFLNACQVGAGQRLLAEQAGFAAESLRGGFGAFIAPLWSVDDAQASDVAFRFYEATLRNGVPAGSALREIRSTMSDRAATPIAYVYYGHPRLRLQPATETPA
jgi:hypothetical protein